MCYSKVTSHKWFYSIKLNKNCRNTKICTKTRYFIEIWRPFWKKRPLTDINCSSLVFSYSLLWFSIAPSDYISLNWMKIVEKIPWNLAAILVKSALTALSSTGIFAGNLISIALWLRFLKIVVSKNPPGGAGFRLLAHRL